MVDDGSDRGTLDYLDGSVEEDGRVELLQGDRRGLGAALRKGLAHALDLGASRIVTMDADLSHDPETIPHLLALEADLVLGSRYVKGGGVPGLSRGRRIMSFAANRFSRFSVGAREKDITTGFRAYSRPMASLVLEESIANGYSFQVEAVHIAKRHAMRVAEVPITFGKRYWGESKLSGRREGAQLLKMLATRSPLRLLLLVALLGAIVNEALLIGLAFLLNLHYLFAGIVAIQAGVFTSFLLNETWTYRGRESKGWSMRLVRYNATVFGGLLLNLFVLFALTEYANLAYALSNLFGIGTALSWNYWLTGLVMRRV